MCSSIAHLDFGFLIRSWTGLQSVENNLTGLQVIKREHFCEHTVCEHVVHRKMLDFYVVFNLILSKVENTNLYLIAGESPLESR